MVKRLFTDAQKTAVSYEIQIAESKTSGEIVVAVADASGDYGRGAGLFAILITFAALTIFWPQRNMAYGYGVFAAVLLLSFQLGLLIAHFVPKVKLPFTEGAEIDRQVERAAAAAYQRCKVSSTVHSTGMLIFVSLLEHRVRVVGDGAITAKLNDKDWKDVCGMVTAGMAKGQPTEGLISAIRASGKLLEAHFPKKIGDTDEISNALNLIEGIP